MMRFKAVRTHSVFSPDRLLLQFEQNKVGRKAFNRIFNGVRPYHPRSRTPLYAEFGELERRWMRLHRRVSEYTETNLRTTLKWPMAYYLWHEVEAFIDFEEVDVAAEWR